MDYQDYKYLYEKLNKPEDIQILLADGYDTKLLETLYTQKISRSVKKRFHMVKNDTPRMMKEWKKGKSFLEIANFYNFPPILIMMFIFQENGTGKKQFWEYIRDPDLLESGEVANEVREAVKNDLVYSPEANDRQKARGIWGEELLQDWLNSQDIRYMTENDLREEDGRETTKTPDCLLKEPMMYNGHKIYWVESKASFGDNVEFRFNSRKQLCPYTNLFGPGVVVYWTGCLNDLECPENVYITDMSILDEKLEKCEE